MLSLPADQSSEDSEDRGQARHTSAVSAAPLGPRVRAAPVRGVQQYEHQVPVRPGGEKAFREIFSTALIIFLILANNEWLKAIIQFTVSVSLNIDILNSQQVIRCHQISLKVRRRSKFLLLDTFQIEGTCRSGWRGWPPCHPHNSASWWLPGWWLRACPGSLFTVAANYICSALVPAPSVTSHNGQTQLRHVPSITPPPSSSRSTIIKQELI